MSTITAKDQVYETMFICPTDLPQKTVEEFTDKLKATITAGKGTVKGAQVWGRRRLAFPIKHHRDGLYMHIDFSGSGDVVAQLNNTLKVSDLVIRYMTVVKEETQPSKPTTKTPSSPSQEK